VPYLPRLEEVPVLGERDAAVTEIQRRILDFFEEHERRHGYAPTLDELRRHLGVSSFGTVSKHVDRLRAKGLLVTAARCQRRGTVTAKHAGRALRGTSSAELSAAAYGSRRAMES
jgi:SOS-response transcriptional repressor LexA